MMIMMVTRGNGDGVMLIMIIIPSCDHRDDAGFDRLIINNECCNFLSWQEKYLLPSPDQDSTESIKPPLTQESIQYEWLEEATELFNGLTGDDKPLRGVMIPWNARIYQQVC